MKKFMWFIAIVGFLAGGLTFIFVVMIANGAPKEASAAMMLALAIIPYWISRTVDELGNKKR